MPPVGIHTGLEYITTDQLWQLIHPATLKQFVAAIKLAAFSHEVKAWSDALLGSIGAVSWSEVDTTAPDLVQAKINLVPIPPKTEQLILAEFKLRG